MQNLVGLSLINATIEENSIETTDMLAYFSSSQHEPIKTEFSRGHTQLARLQFIGHRRSSPHSGHLLEFN